MHGRGTLHTLSADSWLLSHDRRPPRPAVAGTDSLGCGEVVKSSCAAAAAELTGPISESQPARPPRPAALSQW